MLTQNMILRLISEALRFPPWLKLCTKDEFMGHEREVIIFTYSTPKSGKPVPR